MVDTALRSQFQPLPSPPTSFVGRAAAVAAVAARLRDGETRLLTLVGPGGVGKTRLAIQAASPAAEAFAGGVAFVDLTPIADPGLVAAAIADALALSEQTEQRLIAAVRDVELLLLLDNFEQVAEAAPLVSRLLAVGSRLTVLATSREPLRIAGERVVAVPPLELPAESDPVESLAESDAVRLLVARADAAGAVVSITAESAPALVAIVRHLDGLPLAIELAAVRLVHLSPQALLARLAQRLPLLTSRTRDVPARQRTMRDAIAWSYTLLPPEEQGFFRRLAVFAGGFALDAVEAVVGAGGGSHSPASQARGLEGEGCSSPTPTAHLPSPAVLDGVAALVDASLARRLPDVEGEPRYGLLETIREFGLEELTAAGEATETARAHAAHFLDLAERAGAGMRGGNQAGWVARLIADHGNLNAALAWAIAHGDADAALRAVTGLSTFWAVNSHQFEGLEWFVRAFALPLASDDARLRGMAYRSAAALAWGIGNFALATSYAEQSLDFARGAGDLVSTAGALNNLGVIAGRSGEHERAATHFDEALVTARAAADPYLIGSALTNLGLIATDTGDQERAASQLEEALAIFRELRDQHRISQILANLGLVAQRRNDSDRAVALFEEALAIQRALGDDRSVAITLEDFGGLLRQLGELDRASDLFAESTIRSIQIGNLRMAGGTLVKLAELAVTQRGFERAAWMLGASDALLFAAEAAMPDESAPLIAPCEVAARHALGEVGYQIARSSARGCSAERIAATLAAPPASAPSMPELDPEPSRAQPGALAEGLTVREAQVLRLLVDGQTDREIATALFISPKTASNHVANILGKLGAETRTAAAAFALRHGLV